MSDNYILLLINVGLRKLKGVFLASADENVTKSNKKNLQKPSHWNFPKYPKPQQIINDCISANIEPEKTKVTGNKDTLMWLLQNNFCETQQNDLNKQESSINLGFLYPGAQLACQVVTSFCLQFGTRY